MIENKIKEYLALEMDQIIEQEQEDETDPVFDMMVDLITSLDADSLTDDQAELLGDILDSVDELGLDDDDDSEDDDSEDDDSEDEVSEKKIQKISRKEHLSLRKDYKRNKAKFKMMNKMFRKTSAYKMWKKKHKRMVKAGRTKTKKYV
jgi:hypothetical protein